MFQNTAAGATIMPSTSARSAIGWYHSPKMAWVGWSAQYFWSSTAIVLCLAGSFSLENASRSFSISGSHGQPNRA